MLRTFLILAALVVSGIGFARLTHKRAELTGGEGAEMAGTLESGRIPARVYLTLSHLPGFFALTMGEENVPLVRSADGKLSGTTYIDPENPVVFLKVSPLAKAADDGDIDDFVELPF